VYAYVCVVCVCVCVCVYVFEGQIRGERDVCFCENVMVCMVDCMGACVCLCVLSLCVCVYAS